MILAIEGPDRAGKTTLFRALQPLLPDARFVPLPSFSISSADDLTRHNLAIWSAVHEDSRLYVCDRSSFVSSQVYERLRGTVPPDVSAWRDRVAVVYLAASYGELLCRHRATEDYVGMVDAPRVLELYEAELPKWRCLRLDATRPTGILAEEAAAWITKLFTS